MSGQQAFHHPEALVGTDWLAGHLRSPGIRVLDASWHLPNSGKTGRAEYERAHIPGAGFFDIDEIADHASPLPHMMPDATRFARAASALGVGNGTRVIVYDHVGGGSGAARAWFMFRAFGHDDVALLDGGLAKWLAEGRTVEAGWTPPRERPFTANPRGGMVRDLAAMLANQSSHAEQVIDARARGRFAGTEPEPREGLRRGHIPGSRNVPWSELLAADKSLLPADRLAKHFTDAGVDLGKPVAASCGSGVSACLLAFGLYQLGKTDVAIYDGSWAEWGSQAELPIATGDA